MGANGDKLTNDESSKARKTIFLICAHLYVKIERRLTVQIIGRRAKR